MNQNEGKWWLIPTFLDLHLAREKPPVFPKCRKPFKTLLAIFPCPELFLLNMHEKVSCDIRDLF